MWLHSFADVKLMFGKYSSIFVAVSNANAQISIPLEWLCPLYLREYFIHFTMCLLLNQKKMKTKGKDARQDETDLAVAVWNMGILLWVEKNNINRGKLAFPPLPILNLVNCQVLLFRVTVGTLCLPVELNHCQLFPCLCYLGDLFLLLLWV